MTEDGTGLVVERAPSFDAVREDWNRLAERSDNVFGTWEWASSWWRHLGGGARPLVTTCRARGGSTLALLPLYIWPQRGLRVVRLIGHGPADELAPLCGGCSRTPTRMSSSVKSCAEATAGPACSEQGLKVSV